VSKMKLPALSKGSFGTVEIGLKRL
jgi:hypothetical protein